MNGGESGGDIIRRIRPTFISRILSGWRVGLTTMLAIISITGFILKFYSPSNLNSKLVILIFITIFFIGLLAAYLRGIQKLVPDTFIDELSSENEYFVNKCTKNNLREADEMTKPYFGRDFIPFEIIEQWRLKNENGFVQITDTEGKLCACFVILGLERSFFDQFITGRVTESQIDSDVVLSFEETKKEDRIYISGIVVRNPGGYYGSKRSRIMIWAMLEYIKKLYGLRKIRTFYALALTKQSEMLVQKMDFEICCDKTARKDKSNLYRVDIHKGKWNKMLNKIGDFSKMVHFEV